jgi:hypothetical protein
MSRVAGIAARNTGYTICNGKVASQVGRSRYRSLRIGLLLRVIQALIPGKGEHLVLLDRAAECSTVFVLVQKVFG